MRKADVLMIFMVCSSSAVPFSFRFDGSIIHVVTHIVNMQDAQSCNAYFVHFILYNAYHIVIVCKRGDEMAVSEAQRRANQKWDAENMAYQTVKVRRDLLEAFRETCAANGDRVNTVLRQAMEEYIKCSKEGN